MIFNLDSEKKNLNQTIIKKDKVLKIVTNDQLNFWAHYICEYVKILG